LAVTIRGELAIINPVGMICNQLA